MCRDSERKGTKNGLEIEMQRENQEEKSGRGKKKRDQKYRRVMNLKAESEGGFWN